jgi:hypothetical protein
MRWLYILCDNDETNHNKKNKLFIRIFDLCRRLTEMKRKIPKSWKILGGLCGEPVRTMHSTSKSLLLREEWITITKSATRKTVSEGISTKIGMLVERLLAVSQKSPSLRSRHSLSLVNITPPCVSSLINLCADYHIHIFG